MSVREVLRQFASSLFGQAVGAARDSAAAAAGAAAAASAPAVDEGAPTDLTHFTGVACGGGGGGCRECGDSLIDGDDDADVPRAASAAKVQRSGATPPAAAAAAAEEAPPLVVDTDRLLEEMFFCDPETVRGERYFEYMQKQSDAADPVYVVRRVGERRVHYLVTSANRVFRWLVQLLKEVSRSARTEQSLRYESYADADADGGGAAAADSQQRRHVPGIVASFVANATGRQPIFAFRDGVDRHYLDRHRLVPPSALQHTLQQLDEPPERPLFFRYTAVGDTSGRDALARVDHLERQARRRRQLAEAAAAADDDDADGATVEAHGDAPDAVRIDIGAAAALDADADAALFDGVSPVLVGDQRQWFLIDAYYWCLYEGYERLLFSSGSYLCLSADGALRDDSNFRSELARYQLLWTHVNRLLLNAHSLKDARDDAPRRTSLIREIQREVLSIESIRNAQAAPHAGSAAAREHTL